MKFITPLHRSLNHNTKKARFWYAHNVSVRKYYFGVKRQETPYKHRGHLQLSECVSVASRGNYQLNKHNMNLPLAVWFNRNKTGRS